MIQLEILAQVLNSNQERTHHINGSLKVLIFVKTHQQFLRMAVAWVVMEIWSIDFCVENFYKFPSEGVLST
jgi:hypothetical protein